MPASNPNPRSRAPRSQQQPPNQRTTTRRILNEIRESGLLVATTYKKTSPWWRLSQVEQTEEGWRKLHAMIQFARIFERLSSLQSWQDANVHQRGLLAVAIIEGYDFDMSPWGGLVELSSGMAQQIWDVRPWSEIFNFLNPLEPELYAELFKYHRTGGFTKTTRRLGDFFTDEPERRILDTRGAACQSE
jgi:hypothetical protein